MDSDTSLSGPEAPAKPQIPSLVTAPTGVPGIDGLIDPPGDTYLNCGPNQDVLLFQSGSGFDWVFGFDPSEGGDMLLIEENINGSGGSEILLQILDTERGAFVNLGGGNGFILFGVGADQIDASDFGLATPV